MCANNFLRVVTEGLAEINVSLYCRIYGFGHLRADCRGPGSAPEPYAHFEYGTTVLYIYFLRSP